MIGDTPQSPPGAHTVAAPQARPAFALAGARLGMSLSDWQASPAAASASPCLPTIPRSGALQMCRAAGVPIGGGRLARNVTFTFVQNRLAKIAFETSIDAFSDTTAQLQRAYGPPTEVARDTVRASDGLRLPHVQMRWRTAGAAIVLDDPTPARLRLSVEMNLTLGASPAATSTDRSPRAGTA